MGCGIWGLGFRDQEFGCGLQSVRFRAPGRTVLRSTSMDCDPFIKSQLASRNLLSGLTWCKFGHVTVEISGGVDRFEDDVVDVDVVRTRHIYDSQGQILALSSRQKCLNRSKLFPLRSPHGGLRPFHQKSTRLRQSTLGSHVV